MSNLLTYSPATKKYIKKLKDQALKNRFKEAFEEIEGDPHGVGEMKKGDLTGVLGYDFKYAGTLYEIAYTIDEDENGNEVIVILAGTREQFYQELKQKIKSFNPPPNKK